MVKINEDVKNIVEDVAELNEGCYTSSGYCLEGMSIENPKEVALAVVTAYLNSIKQTGVPKDNKIKIVIGDDGLPDVATYEEDDIWRDLYGRGLSDDEVVFWIDPADIMPEENK